MTAVFVDTAYLIARLRPADQWHGTAVAARERLGDVSMVTTDEVLGEVLTSCSGTGEMGRRLAAAFVRDVLEMEEVRVVPQSRQSFLEGLSRYEERLDKRYSVQDCISMNLMDAEGIREVLTSDHNFEQEGFTILMKRG